MIVIKWRKDETRNYPSYFLYAYIDSDYAIQIGWVAWSSTEHHWYFRYNIPRIKDKHKIYEQYTINEINDVLFRAVLDIQSDLSFINNMCVDYCNAISDYVIDYVQGIDHNEN